MPSHDMTPKGEAVAEKNLVQAQVFAAAIMSANPEESDVFTVATAVIAILLGGFENLEQRERCAETIRRNALNLADILAATPTN